MKRVEYVVLSVIFYIRCNNGQYLVTDLSTQHKPIYLPAWLSNTILVYSK